MMSASKESSIASFSEEVNLCCSLIVCHFVVQHVDNYMLPVHHRYYL